MARRLAALLLLGFVLAAGLAHAATPEEVAVYERIARSPALGLGTGRALLLQLANPKIAAGVAEHSTVAADPSNGLARLRATAQLGLALMVGGDEEASAAAAHINHVHDQVKGRVSEGTAAVPQGSRYSAHDPRLQYWVLATLVDSMIKSHETFAGPLSASEKDIFTQEAFRRVGLRLRLREDQLPSSFAEVEAQVRDGLGGGDLEVTPSARKLGRAIAEPPLPLRSLRRTARLVTVGMLPPEVRDAYGLGWRPRDRMKFETAAKAARTMTRSTMLRSIADGAIDRVVRKVQSGPKPAPR